MKTKIQVLKEWPEKASLINAVIRRIGMENVEDVINHGIDGGFPGFTYYSDTCSFYRRHRNAINQWVKEMAEEFGQNAVDFVQSFGCLKDHNHLEEIGHCIYGSKPSDDTIQVENALAWFTAEEVCRLFEE